MHATSDPFGPYQPLREVPIYLHTTCLHCGADQGVAVRYRSSVLCLDCYRDAKRRERELRRRLTVLPGAGG
jgi:hypothetical protein